MPPPPSRGTAPGVTLPIDALRERFLELISKTPVVLTSPTGSGKSTQVPRWCPGPVLVVEPRRVACRTLAQRVASLEGVELGGEVGYQVRDEQRCSERTRILFATPGMVLRHLKRDAFETIILDEFHERGLETDLLLALLKKAPPRRLVVMSATMDADRVAAHLGGERLHAEVRTFPVAVRHIAEKSDLPDASKLDRNVRRALDEAASDPGDILVFLPGKSEIYRASRALSGRRDLCVIELHGGLSLDDQRRAFEPSPLRKVVLATNVAETSITLPGTGVVIDAGLVRQTRYHQGRGFLTLCPVAQDSADQRAGRAGRTGPGVCYRLWSAAARLDAATAPEVHRESLVPLVLAAAAWGERVARLPFLDPPKPYALEAAEQELQALGAIEGDGKLTPLGRELFDLPLDAPLARLLIQARLDGCLDDVIDLVAALAARRSLFSPGGRGAEDLRAAGCDITALVRAVREGRPDDHGLDAAALQEARQNAARLRRGLRLPARPDRERAVDREAVLKTALAADPRCAHVTRTRGRDVTFSNGGTEIELGRESAVNDLKDVEALVVLDTTALGLGQRDTRVLITCASPLSLRQLEKAGLGRDRLAEVMLDRGRVVARIERVYAKKVLSVREEPPSGPVAREAIARLFARGRLFPEAQRLTANRLRAQGLLRRLVGAGMAPGPAPDEPLALEAWALDRLTTLGVEGGDDLALLSAADLTAPDIDPGARALLERQFPLNISVGDAHYEVDYDLGRRQATLRMVAGSRHTAPPSQFLPALGGFKVCVEGPSGMWIVRR